MRNCMPFLAVLAVLVAGADAQPVTRPTTQPADPEVALLIEQLGDIDPAVRESASERLKQIGKPALPQIRQAVESGDPEIRSSAAALVRRIERRPIPQPSAPGPNRSMSRSIRVSGGTTTINSSENGRKITTVISPDRIEMTVTGLVDGKEATETYTAGSPDELKQEDPELFRLYEEQTGVLNKMQGGVVLQQRLGAGAQILPPLGLVGPVKVQDRVVDLQLRAMRAMGGANARDRVELTKLFMQLRQAEPANATDEQRDRYYQQFYETSDKVREVLEAIKVEDTDNVLAPPAKWRLGVVIATDTDNGLKVAHVVSGSRGELLGMKKDDVIRQVNGAAVKDVAALHKALAEAKAPVSVEIVRDGKAMALKEKTKEEAKP